MYYHISHDDLDGYCSQFITKKILDEEVKFINTSYKNILDELHNIKMNDNFSVYDKLIITDLSFNREELEYLLNNFSNNDLIFIDHHQTTLENLIDLINEELLYADFIIKEDEVFLKLYNWKIYINTNHSAAKLYYNFIIENGLFKDTKFKPNYLKILEEIKYMVELTDIYDMWRIENKDFYKSVFYSNLIFSKFPFFPEEERIFNFYLIDKIGNELKNNTVIKVEQKLTNVIHKYLEENYKEELKEIENAENIDIKTFISLLQFNNIKKYSIKIGNIYILKDYSVDILQYGTIHLFKKEKDCIIIGIKEIGKGTKLSIRSNNGKAIEVAKLFNGGGHPNAAGAITSLKFDEIIGVLKNYVKG